MQTLPFLSQQQYQIQSKTFVAGTWCWSNWNDPKNIQQQEICYSSLSTANRRKSSPIMESKVI